MKDVLDDDQRYLRLNSRRFVHPSCGAPAVLGSGRSRDQGFGPSSAVFHGVKSILPLNSAEESL